MRSVLVALATLLLAGCSALPFSRSKPAPVQAVAAGGEKGQGKDKFEPYAKVIPVRAVSYTGLFTTHMVDEKLFFEIPREALGVEMLLITTTAKNTGGHAAGTQHDDRLVRWERRGDRILLRSPYYEVVADSALPIYRAVAAANYASIISSFEIKSWGPDSTAVIDVTSLFTSKYPEISTYLRGSLEKDRTFVERAAAYPENVEVTATHTYTVTPARPADSRFQQPPRTESVVLHWSMVRLPDVPMKPRIADSRMGYFYVDKTDFGTEEHRASRYRYINRWRLECAPGESAPCEPVKPIVFHVDPATPAQWVPYIKKGVEDWQAAFEEAGFKNAIIARDAPTDPKWSPDDARYSMVRWVPSRVENAVGPHVHDPRTGEILVSDIQMYHNVLNLLRSWYFVQVAPLDARARELPLPDSLMGRLLQYVVAHEVGHTLGLQHNMKASSMYPADSLRNEDFLRRMGHVSSIMDYARFNYVAQPEDNIPPELLVPDVGPYDRFAIRWGYKPVPGVKSSHEARSVLDEWLREQDEKPWLRFSTSGSGGSVVGEAMEAIGDADAVYSTRLGIKNIRRIVPMLIPAAVQEGEDFADLRELYDRLIGQWTTELQHVAGIIGSVEGQEKYGGQEGVRFEPLPARRQREAIAFLNEAAFQTPEFFLDREILRRIEPSGALNRIGKAQARILNNLLYNGRLQRMVEYEALRRPGEDVYTVAELLREVRRGIWTELSGAGVRIPAARRNLQNEYLALVDEKLNSEDQPDYNLVPADVQALLRQELTTLDSAVRTALPRASDALTRAHLQAARTRIERILEPRS